MGFGMDSWFEIDTEMDSDKRSLMAPANGWTKETPDLPEWEVGSKLIHDLGSNDLGAC